MHILLIILYSERMKPISIIIALMLSVLPLSAAPADSPEAPEIDMSIAPNPELLDFPDIDTLMLYGFAMSYEGLLQGVGDGGLIAYTSDNEWVTGWRPDTTPVSFFESLPRSTLVTPVVLPKEAAAALFIGLGDIASARIIKGLPAENTHLIVISFWKTYGEVTLRDPLYVMAERLTNERIQAHGLDPESFYKEYEAISGVTEMDFITSMMAPDANADKAIENAMSAIRVARRDGDFRGISLERLFIGGGIAFVAATIFLLIAFRSGSALSDYNDDAREENPEGEHNARRKED